MDLSEILCVIPARGGSKGIPQKNLRLLGGIHLVEHSIIHALNVGFDPNHIYVSSDDESILDIAAEKHRVVALERPYKISGSNSSTEETLIHVLESYTSFQKAGKRPDLGLKPCKHVLLLQPTSPIRFPDTVSGFLEFYTRNEYDSALTATEFHDFFWHVGKERWESTYNPQKRPMRQAIPLKDNRLFDNGNMYITSTEILTTQQCRLGGEVGVYPISELEGMQIDTPRDLFLFESIFDGTMSTMTGVRDESV